MHGCVEETKEMCNSLAEEQVRKNRNAGKNELSGCKRIYINAEKVNNKKRIKRNTESNPKPLKK